MPAPGASPKSSGHTPQTPVNIWYARCPTLSTLGLVANRGVLHREFLRDNVNLLSVRENATTSVREANLDHSLTHLIREGDAATALWSYSQNQRSRLVAIGTTYHTISIVVPQRSHIRALKDLTGRRLSVPREVGPVSPARIRALRAWESVLAFADLPLADVEFVNVIAEHPTTPFGSVAKREIEALLSGETEAAILIGAKGLEHIRSANLREIYRFTPDQIAGDARLEGLIEIRTLSVDHVLSDAHPELVARFVSRLLEAHDWAETFPREAFNQASIESQTEIEQTELAHGDLLGRSAGLGLEADRLALLERLTDWLKVRNLITESPLIEDWAVPQILSQAAGRLGKPHSRKVA